MIDFINSDDVRKAFRGPHIDGDNKKLYMYALKQMNISWNKYDTASDKNKSTLKTWVNDYIQSILKDDQCMSIFVEGYNMQLLLEEFSRAEKGSPLLKMARLCLTSVQCWALQLRYREIGWSLSEIAHSLHYRNKQQAQREINKAIKIFYEFLRKNGHGLLLAGNE